MSESPDNPIKLQEVETIIVMDQGIIIDEDDILYQGEPEPSVALGRTKRKCLPSKKGALYLAEKQVEKKNSQDQQDSSSESDEDFEAPKSPSTPSGKSMPKIVLKSQPNSLTKRDCELIKDCVEALADQDCLETFKLRTREDGLCKADWWLVSDIIVKLMRQYLTENGVTVIDHKHIEQARYQMKETYKWAGHVVGKDFQYSPSIRSIAQDACYNAMRNRNNFCRPKQKLMLTKRTLVRKTHKANKKMRTADSYGVLVYEDLDVQDMSDEKRRSYQLFCQEISKVPVGHQLSLKQIETASSYWDCLLESLVNVKPEEIQDFLSSEKLALLRHLRLYSNFVQKITRREDVVMVKFQENCDMYLACLQDLLKYFPPLDKLKVKGVDIDASPYISLVKIIAYQLGKKAAFILDESEVDSETLNEAGPICLLKSGNLYNLCINGVVVVPNLQDIQAIFCFATSEDVFRISQVKASDSIEVIDFMRKFLLDIPDFHIKRPKISLLGQAFRCLADFERSKNGRCPRPNKMACYEKANEVIQCF